MFGTARSIWTVASSPFWLLWRGYCGLWWAFNTPPKGMGLPKVEIDQSKSFEVVDSRPKPDPLPRPTATLRTGFIATLAASVTSGIVTSGLSGSQSISPSTALIAWGWITALTAVGSMMVARRVAIKKAQRGPSIPRKAADAAQQAAQQVAGAAVGAAKSSGRRVGAFARKAATVTGVAAAKAYGVAKSAANSPQAKSAWSSTVSKVRDIRDAAVRGWKSPAVSHDAPTSKV
jgi:hypothetical protein